MVDWYSYVQAVISMLLTTSPPDPVKVLFFDVPRPPAGNRSLTVEQSDHGALQSASRRAYVPIWAGC
jgi:hypothetical protein